jgi:hypothetical protein
LAEEVFLNSLQLTKKHFSVYEIHLTSEFHFQYLPVHERFHASHSSARFALRFTCSDQPYILKDIDILCLSVLPSIRLSLDHQDEKLLDLYQLQEIDLMRFIGSADYYLGKEFIHCHLFDQNAHYLVEIYFLGVVLSFWLERLGVRTIHASALSIDGTALVFLSTHGAGKSALAGIFVQAGYPLLTDDILPVEDESDIFIGRPGYPTMRMWPDEAEHFLGSYEHLPLVHPELTKRRVFIGPDGFGTFCEESQPIACIYLPERRDPSDSNTAIKIMPVSPRDGVIELVRHSFSAHLAEAAGLAPQRLDFFARMVKQVPMRRLIYPSGFHHLPRVREAILEDLQKISSQ